jgi:PKD repeat protein
VGLNAAGTAALPNGDVEDSDSFAVIVEGDYVRIGTNDDGVSDALERNTISGNSVGGIQLLPGEGNARDAAVRAVDAPGIYTISIAGNAIGTGTNGSGAFGNMGNGITVSSNSGVLIGGESTAHANIIANNTQAGISVPDSDGRDPRGVSILTNSIFGNGGPGIDLGGDGVTANDLNDADDGPNALINFPVLGTIASDRLSVSGTLNSELGGKYRIQLFASSAQGRQGKTFLGQTDITFDGMSNDGAFSVSVNGGVPFDSFLTVTSTRIDDSEASTSEFSEALATPIKLRFASGPNVTPTSLLVGESVAATAMPNIPGATVSVNFGDGSAAETGESTSHTYTAPGIYTVTFTLNGADGQSEIGTVQVTVTAPAAPPGPTAIAFRVRVLNVFLNGKPGRDKIQILGVLNIPGDFTPAGKTFDVNIGGVTQTFTLDARGKGKTGNSLLRFRRSSRFRNEETPFVLTLKRGTFEAALRQSPVKPDANGLPTSITVSVTFLGATYEKAVPVTFKTRGSRSRTKFGPF